MKKRVPYIVSLAAITGFLAIAPNIIYAQPANPLLADALDQAQFPIVTVQPVDQAVIAGSNVVLSVQAMYVDNYQWQSNGNDMVGQTNSTLILQNLRPNDAGLYSCNVSQNGGDPVPTRVASVEVETTANATTARVAANGVMASGILGGGPITVSGGPKASNGTQGTCPGSYAGYVIYTKTISQGWGWTPVAGTTNLVASDGSGRTDTKVTYSGKYGDSGCGQTSVTIPYPPPSPAYRFAIYFPSDVPTTNYNINLGGFNP